MVKELNVSVIIIKRVYEEFEKEGFIVIVLVRGIFVVEIDKEKIFNFGVKEIEEDL